MSLNNEGYGSIWLSARPYYFNYMYHNINELNNSTDATPVEGDIAYVNTTKYKYTSGSWVEQTNSIDTYPTFPHSSATNMHTLDDTSFIPLGVITSYSQSLPYSLTTTGILTQSPDKAIVVDSTNGSINTISISTTRPIFQKVETNNLSTYTSGTMTYYGVDCNYTKDGVTHTREDYRYIDISDFINKLIQLKAVGQMFYPALVLRIYNFGKATATTPVDMFVYLDTFSCEVSDTDPSCVNISLTFIERNKWVTGTIGE